MKKFYALAIAALALSASAQGIQAGYDLNPVKAKSEKLVRAAAPLRAAATVKPTAVPTLAEVQGVYTWECYEYLTDENGKEVGESTYSVKITALEDNNVSILTDYGTFEGTFNPETGNINIEVPQLVPASVTLSDGTALDAYLYHAVWTSGEEFEQVEDPIELTYVNGGYETGVDDLIAVMAVAGEEDAGYFHFAGVNVFTKFQEEIPEGWTEVGLCLYQDSWAINLFSVDPANYQYYVTVVKSDEDENVIRILNPYTALCAFSYINDNTAPGGVIEFNIGNPNFVWLTGGLNSGFTFAQAELVDMTCWNLEGYLKYKNPTADDATIIENLESNELEISNLTDGVITVCNTVFGMESDPYAPNSWQNKQGQSMMTNAILWLEEAESGINNVIADSNNNVNAPVVFYNLQGVQVADPRGGIFIRKQGNEATKVIIK